MKWILIAIGAAIAWSWAKHTLEVHATVTVPQDEIDIRPARKEIVAPGAYDEDAPLPLGGLQ